MCCEGFHDVQAKLDVPGHIRFVMVCTICGREQREIGRQPYMPDPHLDGVSAPAPKIGPVSAIAA